MGVEVEGSEVPKVNGEAGVVVHDMENGKANVSEPITFGSHGVDEEKSKGEAKNVSNPNLPKDAVDEWPAEPQVYSFWIVKCQRFDDPKLMEQLDKHDRNIQKKSTQIDQLYEEIKPIKAQKDELHAILATLGEERSQYTGFWDQKLKEIKPLQVALGDLRGSGAMCSSEEELNKRIRSFEYRIQHEGVPLKEEKQILRDIRDLEATRPKVIAYAAMRAKLQESMGPQEALQDQVKSIGTDLDGVRKQKAAIKAKTDQYWGQILTLKDQITKLYKNLDALKVERQAEIEAKQELRKKLEAANSDYYKNRAIMNGVKELAAKKDVKAVEELANSEVEKFMSQWNSNKAFRNTYEKSILLSLDKRQLSRDGRMRNFDEKPLVKVDTPAPSEPVVASRTSSKPQKEDSKTTPKPESLPVEKAQTETKKGNKESKAILERSMEEDVFVVEKPKKVSNGNEIDATKLKEMKKEEEKEKQRQALERKKKLQEKAALKAALKAQKEAEKKQKEREKKMKKKEGPAQPADEEEAAEKADVDELEKSDNAEEATEMSAPPKAKEQNALRNRKTVKSRGALPKAIIRKKKSANYMLWASAGAAAVVVLMLLVLGFNYLQTSQVVG